MNTSPIVKYALNLLLIAALSLMPGVRASPASAEQSGRGPAASSQPEYPAQWTRADREGLPPAQIAAASQREVALAAWSGASAARGATFGGQSFGRPTVGPRQDPVRQERRTGDHADLASPPGLLGERLKVSALPVAAGAYLPPDGVARASNRTAGPCNVTGFITVNTTWGPALCDPYIVTGSLMVQTGITLTILPGTTVKFNSLRSLQVRGQLVARGDEAQPIVFTSNLASPAPGDWGYIHFTDTSLDATFDGEGNYTGGSIIQYAVVEYSGGAAIAENGAVRIEASSPFIDHTAIRENAADGIHVWSNGAPRMTYNTINENAFGISAVTDGALEIGGNTIADNGNVGIILWDAAASIHDNAVSGNGGSGIAIQSGAASDLRGNTVIGNAGSGMDLIHGFYTVEDNTVSGNATGGGGGGIRVHISGSTVGIRGNTVADNAATNGGGIYVYSEGIAGPFTLAENTITGNTAQSGGGIYILSPGGEIANNLITVNAASQANAGGGIFLCDGCMPTINNNDLYGNLAGDSPGAPNDLYNGNGAGSPDVNAENNFWGTTDPAEVEDRIWHYIDDGALGLVDYDPFCSAPCSGLGIPTDITSSLTYNDFWGTAGPYATVTATLRDGGGAFKGYGVARADALGWFGWTYFYDQGRRVDVLPGDQIDFNVGGAQTSVTLGDIGGTLDPNTDGLTGSLTGAVAYPLDATLTTHGKAVAIAVDAPGDFAYDFSGLTDIRQDDSVEVTYEAAPGFSVSGMIFPQDGYTVYHNWDGLWGYTTPGAEVAVTVRDGGGAVKDSGTTTASGDDGGWWYQAASDIVPGDTLEVQLGGGSYSSTVSPNTTDLDLTNDLVYGTGPANSTVYIRTCQWEGVGRCHLYEAEAPTDGDGNFSTALTGSGALDLDRMSWVIVAQTDTERAETAHFGTPPLAAVNITYNNVWGRAEPGAMVRATLRDDVGTIKSDETVQADGAGHYEAIFGADVIAGDTVEVNGGGVSTTVLVENLTALADPEEDAVAGEAPGSAPMYVEGWHGTGRGFGERFLADEGGMYNFPLGGRLDLLNGYNGHSYYAQADDHRAFYHWYAPVIHVNQTYDGVWGYAPQPNAEVTLTVRDSEGNLKAETTVVGDGMDGYFEAFFDGSVDTAPWDTVEAVSGDWSTVATLVDLQAWLDPAADLASGIGPSNTPIHIQTWDNGYADLWVPSDPDGNWAADLSGMADLLPGSSVRVAYEDAAGNEISMWGLAAYVRVNQTHDWVQGNVGPDLPVVATLLDSEGAFKARGETYSDGWGWFHTDFWDEFGNRANVLAYDRVQVQAGDDFFDVFVNPISGSVDVAADSASGQIGEGTFPASFYAEVWMPDGPHVEGTTDGDGNYLAEFAPYDVLSGHETWVVYRNPDGNEVGAVFSALSLSVGITYNWVDVDTDAGATVDVDLRAPDGELKESRSTVADAEGYASLQFDADIQIGDVLEARADGRVETVTVEELTAIPDVNSDCVSGTGLPNAPLWVNVWGHGTGASRESTVDENGLWNECFDGEFDIQAGDSGNAWIRNPAGHNFGVDYNLPQVQVHFRFYDWVQGTMTPGSNVHLILRDAEGGVKSERDTGADGNGWFWADFYDAEGNGVDIAPGDSVEVADGTQAFVVPVTDIEGHVDVEANTFWGHVYDAGCPAQVRAEIWSPYDGPGESFWTDEACDFFYDFSPYDMTVGQWVNLWYLRPDGHMVGSVVSALRLNTNLIDDNLWGIAAPGAEVAVTLRDGEGNVKDAQSAPADPDGGFGLGFAADVALGDTIEGAYNPFASLPIVLTAQADPETDTVFGTAPPGVYLRLDFWGHDQGIHREFWVDETGNWGVSLAGEFDIQPTDEGWVGYENRDGHEVHLNIRQPYIRVNQSHDWVDGQASPYATVWLTLSDGEGNVKGTTTTAARPDGWFDGVNPCDTGCDIQAGDRVHADFSDGVSRDAEVLAMTGTVDANANTMFGQVMGGVFPARMRGEAWWADSWSVESTTDGDGNYLLDFNPYDIRPGPHNVAWYLEPDGDHIGVVRAALRVRAYPTDDWLDGETAANTLVEVTLRDGDGNVKGTAQIMSDDEGRWWGDILDGGEHVEIDGGDTVEMWAGGQTASVWIPDHVVSADSTSNILRLKTDLPFRDMEIRWDSAPGAGDLANSRWTTTDENGRAVVDLSDVGLELGTDGNVYLYENEDGQWVEPWWRARLDSVAPQTVYNNAEAEIAIYGVGFLDEPGSVLLGAYGPPTIELERTFISDTEVRATLPAGTPPGDYYVLVPFSDERNGYLQEGALTVIEAPAVTLDDTAYGITYDGWAGVADPQASGGGYRVASAAGQAITYRTTKASTAVTLITYRGPDQGKAQVVIDGVSKGTLDLYSPTPEYQYAASYSGLTNARHTVVVKALHQKNAQSSGYDVRVDAFRVGATTTEDDNPGVKYTAWTGKALAAAYGGSLRYTGSRNASVYFDIVGSQFTWIAARGRQFGKADVIVDGVTWGTVDLCNATAQWQYPVVIGGLSGAAHRVQIKVLGAHSASCNGNVVVFDGYSVP